VNSIDFIYLIITLKSLEIYQVAKPSSEVYKYMNIKNIFSDGDITITGGNVIFGNGSGINGSGKVTEKQINITEFNAVESIGPLTINIVKGEKLKAIISADDNIIDLVKVQVFNQTLFVELNSNSSFSTNNALIVKIEMPNPAISSLSLTGSGDIIISINKTEHLNINLVGSGDIKIESGETDSLRVNLVGSGDVKLKKLKAQDVTVNIQGSGDVSIYGKNSLNLMVQGSGDITYYGPGKVSKRVRGSGDIECGE
jgi:hypothetical protein